MLRLLTLSTSYFYSILLFHWAEQLLDQPGRMERHRATIATRAGHFTAPSVFWSNDSITPLAEWGAKESRQPWPFSVCELKWGHNWNQLFRWDGAGMRPECHHCLTRIEQEAGGEDKRIWFIHRASASSYWWQFVFLCTLLKLQSWCDRRLCDKGRLWKCSSTSNPAKGQHRDKELMYTDAFTDLLVSLYCLDPYTSALHGMIFVEMNENTFQQNLNILVMLNANEWTPASKVRFSQSVCSSNHRYSYCRCEGKHIIKTFVALSQLKLLCLSK